MSQVGLVIKRVALMGVILQAACSTPRLHFDQPLTNMERIEMMKLWTENNRQAGLAFERANRAIIEGNRSIEEDVLPPPATFQPQVLIVPASFGR